MSYTKKSIPPANLQILIDAFNELVDYRQHHEARVRELFQEAGQRLIGLEGEAFAAVQREYETLIEAELHPAIRAACREPWVVGALGEIELLVIEKETLRDVVKAWANRGRKTFHLSRGHELPYRFDDEGTIVSSSRILDIFRRMTPDRVRECVICKKMFWARKSNAQTCSPDHAAELGNRKRSPKYKAALEALEAREALPPEIW